MKKGFLIIIIILSFFLIYSYSNKKNVNELATGMYVEVDNGFAWVILKENNKFEFNRPIITSYRPSGSYNIQKDELILKVSEEEEYRFKIDGDKLVFESGKHIENFIENGAVFQFTDE